MSRPNVMLQSQKCVSHLSSRVPCTECSIIESRYLSGAYPIAKIACVVSSAFCSQMSTNLRSAERLLSFADVNANTPVININPWSSLI